MAMMSLKETLIQEIETLPEPRQLDVLAFVRFLKIGLADEQTVERRLVDALARAQAIAQERGITDQDIEDEIRAVRSGQ
jgi:hypothetical protein